jgi:hypothetical protein
MPSNRCKINLLKSMIVLITLLNSNIVSAECIIKMVFKMGDKFPLMHAAPDNSGIFNDLYSEAAR